MAKRKKNQTPGVMLEYWRPPADAGDPIGCLTTTYTFQPGLFDEQCLARFLEVESEPNREDLAFLLERETRLGAAYAGVLVDHTQAGVEHSLRWDVLPVRIPGAKQHAKLSLLAWSNHVRLLVTSANLTEQGYRFNQEVAATIDNSADGVHQAVMQEGLEFLRSLLAFVPGAGSDSPEIRRAVEFLRDVEERLRTWSFVETVEGQRQHLVFTLPSRQENPATGQPGFESRSTLASVIERCRPSGGDPNTAWVASPFFDEQRETDAATAALCEALANDLPRTVGFCVPAVGEVSKESIRLAAPSCLVQTATQAEVENFVEILPPQDNDKNHRPWHAKIISFYRDETYAALCIGSSNFTKAGLGVGGVWNAEANLLTIADRGRGARLPKQLDEVWPKMKTVENLEIVEWQRYAVARHSVDLMKLLDEPLPPGDVRLIPPKLAFAFSDWYLTEFDQALAQSTGGVHPKIAATVEKAVDLWEAGEKVLVFAFYRQTCRALRIHISLEIERRIMLLAQRQFTDAGQLVTEEEIEKILESIQDRYMDKPEAPGRRELDQALRQVLARRSDTLKQIGYGDEERDRLIDTMRRFLRVTTTLVRCFPIAEHQTIDPKNAVDHMLDRQDGSGQSWRAKFEDFVDFLLDRCSTFQRETYLEAAARTQTGAIRVKSDEDSDEDATMTLANVQVASGMQSRPHRTRLMLAFNTPFFPDIFVCSEVMGEGVDLQRYCRYVIHHDLAWNPSQIEQRTGRIDRLGCKAENRHPIHVCLPYLAGAACERQYRVMSDREQWFRIVMGQDEVAKLIPDDADQERPALPTAFSEGLSFNLGLS